MIVRKAATTGKLILNSSINRKPNTSFNQKLNAIAPSVNRTSCTNATTAAKP